jgi:nicotinate-nucleotide pyrophosphorylase
MVKTGITPDFIVVDGSEGGTGAAPIEFVDHVGTPLREAVERCRARVITEASGGVTLDTVRSIAETGVDRISIGALTHSAPALDLGLDFDDL